MKKLIFVNGTMGVGKTATCKELLDLLPKSVFLDGDWCWMMNPWIVTDETKKMVEDNIAHTLSNFLNCSVYEYVIFSWVMHQSEIIEKILSSLDDAEFELHVFSLVCSEEALEKRLLGDPSRKYAKDTLKRSVERLCLYEKMQTEKIDVSSISALQAAKKIVASIRGIPLLGIHRVF